MIRRILITDDAGNSVPVPASAFRSILALAADVLGARPESVTMLSSDYSTGFRFDADVETSDEEVSIGGAQ